MHVRGGTFFRCFVESLVSGEKGLFSCMKTVKVICNGGKVHYNKFGNQGIRVGC